MEDHHSPTQNKQRWVLISTKNSALFILRVALVDILR